MFAELLESVVVVVPAVGELPELLLPTPETTAAVPSAAVPKTAPKATFLPLDRFRHLSLIEFPLAPAIFLSRLMRFPLDKISFLFFSN